MEPARPAVPPTAPLEPAALRPRERAFNVPWPVLALVLSFSAVAAVQLQSPDPGAWFFRYGLVPIELSAGRLEGLITSQFLHGGVAHLAMNSLAALAFGAPVARLFGSRIGGALLFLLFFLLCGVAAGLTFWALHPQTAAPLVGASGGISGLMGAAARLIERPGRVGPLFSRSVLGLTAAWVVLNLIIAAVGFAPGAVGIPIAWEAHLGGLFAGLLLIGPFARLRGRGRSD